MVLGQVSGHPQQPGTRVEDHLAGFPLLPEPEKRFLRDVQRGVGTHPPGVGQGPDFLAVPLVKFLELGTPGTSGGAGASIRARIRGWRGRHAVIIRGAPPGDQSQSSARSPTRRLAWPLLTPRLGYRHPEARSRTMMPPTFVKL